MTFEGRAAVVLAYLRAHGGPGTRASVDVLNSDFVDHYVKETGAELKHMPYGAHKCRELGRTLSRMHRERQLDRQVCGLREMRGMGFPAWVWSYKIKETP